LEAREEGREETDSQAMEAGAGEEVEDEVVDETVLALLLPVAVGETEVVEDRKSRCWW
jgi:hypothetical protein